VLRIGPLHLLGLLLACCQVLVVVLRRRRPFVAAISVLFALVLCGAPWVWQSKLSASAPLFVATWLDATHGSGFPVFPWAAFVLAGVLTAAAITRDSSPRKGDGLDSPIVAVAPGRLALWLGGVALVLIVFTPRIWFGGYGPDAWFDAQTSPFFVLLRLGYVLAVLGALSVIDTFARKRPQTWSFTALVSRRSLVAYVAHLLLLYGTPLSPNFAARIGPTLSLEASLLATGLVLGTSVLIVWVWDLYDAPERASSMRARSAGRAAG
jgi:hypothetical protein